MSIINVPPTKTKQLELKKDLATATEGHALLEQKREILVMELMRLVDRVKEAQQTMDERRKKAYATLRRAVSYNGYAGMQAIAAGISYEHQVTVGTRVVAGIRLPDITTKVGDFTSQFGFAATNALVDQTMADYLGLLEAISQLAELENAVWLLARELKKTQRHVNALEHIFIPDYRDTLNYINQTLESRELDSFFTMKMVKKNMEQSAEEV